MEEVGTITQDNIDFDVSKIQIVDIGEVRPNTWNPKDLNTKEYQRVKLSVEKNGLRGPIIVRENNGFEIIDGEQRWRSCNDLGYKKVIIYNEGKISDQKAKELTIWYQQQVPFNEVKLAWLIKDLVSDVDVNIPYSQEEIDAYLKTTQFNMDDFKKNDLPPNTNQTLTFAVKVSKSQYEVIKQAVDKFVNENSTPELTISQSEAFTHIMNWWWRANLGKEDTV